MFNKKPYHWTFYIKDLNGNYTLISDRICTRPTKTNNFKTVSKLLNEGKEEQAGCMLYDNFKINYQE